MALDYKMKKVDFHHRLFSFFLCKKTYSPPHAVSHWTPFQIGDWLLFISPENPYRLLNLNDDTTCVYIGEIFELNKNDPFKTEGHYIAFVFDSKKQSLTIFRNKNSPIGIYYSENTDDTCFWGDFQWGHSNLNFDWSLDSSSLEDFFDFGLITNGKTLFSNIKQLPFQKYIKYQNNSLRLISESSLTLDSKVIESPSSIYEFLIARIQIWLNDCHFNSIALSGGADSRMIFAALNNFKDKSKIKVHSRIHPQLSEEQDADFVIAKNICQTIGLPHSGQKARSHPSAYLSQDLPADPPIFSALYGGEYLGGEVINLIAKNALSENSNSPIFANCIHLLAQAFTCDFYGGAWFPVFAHHNLTLTPFWDSQIIQLLLSIETENIKDYRLYNEVLDHLPTALRTFPYQSQLTDYYPNRPKPPAPLLNPKFVSSPEMSRNREIYDLIPEKYHKIESTHKGRFNAFESLVMNFKI